VGGKFFADSPVLSADFLAYQAQGKKHLEGADFVRFLLGFLAGVYR